MWFNAETFLAHYTQLIYFFFFLVDGIFLVVIYFPFQSMVSFFLLYTKHFPFLKLHYSVSRKDVITTIILRIFQESFTCTCSASSPIFYLSQIFYFFIIPCDSGNGNDAGSLGQSLNCCQ